MMKAGKPNRTRIIGLRLTPEEYDKIERRCKTTTCQKLSDFIRRVIFEKPIITTYRNKSEDEGIAELTRLRTELNHIGVNVNQAVKRLHTLQNLDEFKSWIASYEIEKRMLANKVDAVKKHMQKLVEKWLQS